MAGGRNDKVIVEALEAMAQELQDQQNPPVDEFRGLGKFHINNP